MDTYTVTFMPDDRSIQVRAGTTLLEAQRMAGYSPEAPCGGDGKCGKCTVEILQGAASGIQKACSVHVENDMTIRLSSRSAKNQILEKGVGRRIDISPWLPDMEKEDPSRQICLAAVDLGTTTIAAYLLDAGDGRTIAVDSCLNPQSPYGADVIKRCEYALAGGADILADCVRQAIDRLIQQMAQKSSLSPEQIVSVCIVGNSCMQHLFLHWPVDSLVAAPYLPYSKEPFVGPASDFQIHIHPQGRLWALPVIESFVGADTLACILATDLEKQEKLTLMIDIGTNGELVLSKDGRLLTCSTAAGPALEGAKISCGMRGGTGAIDHVTLDADRRLSYSTIGDCDAVGICGSGLLDLTACLLDLGIIDETGYMEEAFQITDKVRLTKQDVRELQLAKAAIAAGIRIMCQLWEVTLDEIEEVLIAGAFGNYMDPKSACAIGLLPLELSGKITPVGNAAGEGAKIAILNEKEFHRACRLAAQIDFLELANRPEFQDTFVDDLSFDQEGL